IPITDSGAPIRNDSGEINGVVMVFRDQIKEHEAQKALEESEATIKKKLNAILEPEGNIDKLNLGDIIDSEKLQALLEDFYKFSKICSAILDISGNVLVAVGWQDICTKFHRVHPDTAKNCLESDLALASDVPAGNFKAYYCKNNMWDMVSPLQIGGKHLGNIYIGQFFYEDEHVDYELFRKQARQYGFDEKEYIAALDRVPRLKRETVKSAMTFYAKLAGMISSLSYSKIKLSRDNTRRKQIEQELIKSEHEMKKAQELTHIGSWYLDVETNSVTWTEEMYKMYGFDPTMAPPPFNEHMKLFTQESWERLSRSLEKTRQTGIPYELELRTVKKDSGNGWMWVRGEAVQNKQGKTIGLWGAAQDITDRKHAEKILQEKNDLLQRIFDSNFDLIALSDLEGNFTLVGKSHEIIGYKSKDLIGKNVMEFVHPDDVDSVSKEFSNFLKSGENRKIAYRYKRIDGTYLWFETIGTILRDEKENPEQILFNTRNITERKLAESEKEKLQSQLLQSQKMESVGQLAGGVAHDFNNMLGVILGHTEMALDEISPGQPVFDNLQEIRKAAERSENLTRQLLTFARKQTIAPKIIDLNETVECMFKMLRRLIGEDIDLNWMPSKKPVPVKADPSQIDQILVNLCVNARDAIEYAGNITIETEVVSLDEEYPTFNPGSVPGDYVLLAVSDNGCGMEKDAINHLFEPFFTTKEQGKGTGLGLASVYGAVKQNNGFIKAYSEPGRGTTFKIYLPLQSEATTAKTHKREEMPATKGSETILLVEDESAILQLTSTILEKMGYSVIAAKAPGEAIHLAREKNGPIDLLITDVVMPEMNGRELAEKMLSIYPGIKRLFMSGYTANIIANQGVLDKGMYFIQKPFSAKDLGNKVREILESKDAD
ncbi:MAG: PocR ligand-binding domain-containing protein, partial [Thermodesulfobacteriota bacterium]